MADDDIPPVGDEFTGPSAAPMPGDDQVELDTDIEGTFVAEDVTCRNCVHFPVCAYYAGIAPMLEQRDDDAIDPGDLAVICDHYLPAEGLDAEAPAE